MFYSLVLRSYGGAEEAARAFSMAHSSLFEPVASTTDLPIELIAFRPSRNGPPRLTRAPGNITEAVAKLASGAYYSVACDARRHWSGPPEVWLECDLKPDFPQFARDLTFSADVRLLSTGVAGPEWSLERFEELTLVMSAVTGHVVVDLSSSPYEDAYSVGNLDPYDYADHVAGYYWIVLLTAGHLARLGGLTHVRTHAPVAELRVLSSTPGAESAIAMLTHLPTDIEPAALRRWREFLQPVLFQRPARRPYLQRFATLVEEDQPPLITIDPDGTWHMPDGY